MTWRTVKGDMLVTLRVPFTVTVDLEDGEQFDAQAWVDAYNDGDSPDALEGANMPWPDMREHEVYESSIDSAELVAESSSSRVHDHGPAEGRGLDCPERTVEGRLRGACLDRESGDSSQADAPQSAWHPARSSPGRFEDIKRTGGMIRDPKVR